MSTQEIVCVWENGVFKTERVNGFWMPCGMYGVRKAFVAFGKVLGQHCEAHVL
jgi:hypothetical protein